MYMMAVSHVRVGKGTLERDPGDATLSLDMTEAVQTIGARGYRPSRNCSRNPAGHTPAGQTSDYSVQALTVFKADAAA